MRYLLTGASGFIGKRLTQLQRGECFYEPISLKTTKVENIDFQNIDGVIHLGGHAGESKGIDSNEIWRVNYVLTKELSQASKKAGIGYFVFMSSVKVYGSNYSQRLDEQSTCDPGKDIYGQSKYSAEEYIRSIEDDGFKVAIIRSPMVYGPEVKGNMLRLLKIVESGWPLPFKAIENRRSIAYIDNLVALMYNLIEHQKSGLYLAGDAEPISTSDLITSISNSMGRQTRLFQVPKLGLWISKIMKPNVIDSLFESLELNTTKTNEKLNFVPPYSTQIGIKVMVEWYRQK